VVYVKRSTPPHSVHYFGVFIDNEHPIIVNKKITQRIHRCADLRDYVFGQTVQRNFRTPLLDAGDSTLIGVAFTAEGAS